MSARSDLILFARDIPAGDGLELVLHRSGQTTQIELTPSMAARLAADLTAWLWRMEQRRAPP